MEESSGKPFRIFTEIQTAESSVPGKTALTSPSTLAMKQTTAFPRAQIMSAV